MFSSADEGDAECLTLYVLQIPVQNRWGMIQMAMKLWPLIFM
ncbi:colicin [Escherichia coli]|nr:colicin [Escherichia coli]